MTFNESKKNAKFARIDSVNMPENTAVQGWIRGYEEPVKLIRQRFKNKDGSTGIVHLVCSDLTCDFDEIEKRYQKRWKVEIFHKSLKSNTSLGKSPTRTVRAQSNHVFMSIYAAFKLEILNIKKSLNPFTLSRKLMIKATQVMYQELQLAQHSA